MPQNIQTFSALTDIDTKRRLLVKLKLVRHGSTKSLTTLNQFVVNVDDVVFELDLFDPIKLQIELLSTESGGGIETLLEINGIEVLPKYQYLSSSGNNYLTKKGAWQFEIPKNFYLWHHNVSGQGFIA